MKIRILGSNLHGPLNRQYSSAYVINMSVAIDAGPLGVSGSPEDQAEVRHVLLTHSHADHVASLPLYLENVFGLGEAPPRLYGHPMTLACLHRHMFNNEIWPDFFGMQAGGKSFVELRPLEPEHSISVDGLRVTPVPVPHTVPTYGYIVDDGHAAVVFAADAAPTQRIWEVARALPHLKAVFLEASFPESLTWLAEGSMHLTPKLFAAEAAKLPAGVRVIAVHIKPRYRAEVIAELEALHIPGLEIGDPETRYEF
jgi:ribonuclease BN (tRNA processing enzyme)